MSNKSLVVKNPIESHAGKGKRKQQTEQKPEPQQMQQQQREQASHHRHHERNIVMAFVAVGVVVILGFFMARYVISLVSSDGDGIGDEAKESRYYNGFKFVEMGGTWFTDWERNGLIYSLEFRHNPWDVEDIPVVGSTDARFQLSYIFITHDPTNESSRGTAFVALAAADLATMLKGVFERQGVAAACTENITEACTQRPVVTCSTNASVIYLKVSNETGIFLDGNCATIQGYEEGLTKAADKAIYQWLGIIKK
ncbi:hypothetical protein HYV85_04875 [Candidatus Woesearchaeota archaeon]|nr:hypothetical protein [Candidatus Woesearchaeota archaeon]